MGGGAVLRKGTFIQDFLEDTTTGSVSHHPPANNPAPTDGSRIREITVAGERDATRQKLGSGTRPVTLHANHLELIRSLARN